MAYYLRSYDYKGLWILLRLAAVAAIANVGLAAMYFLTNYLFFDLKLICDYLGGYVTVAAIYTVMFWIFDFVFHNGTKYLSKYILRGRKK